jgi:hypothetical protein
LLKALIHYEKCGKCYGQIGGEDGITTLHYAVIKINETVKEMMNENKD